MIEHVITIRLVEDLDSLGLEITTPPTLSTLQTVGLFEMAKKQYIESKHQTGPTSYQESNTENWEGPHTLGHEGSDRWTGGDKKDEA